MAVIEKERLDEYARIFDFVGYEIVEIPDDGRVKFRFGLSEEILQFTDKEVEGYRRANKGRHIPDSNNLPGIKYYIVLNVLIWGMDVYHFLLTDGAHRREKSI